MFKRIFAALLIGIAGVSCQDTSGRFLVVGGYTDYVELVDLDTSVKCGNISKFPVDIQGSVGAFVRGRPLVCGGHSSEVGDIVDCYSYDLENDAWALETNSFLSETRTWASSAVLGEEEFYILGGENIVSTSDIIKDGESRPGPNLPEGNDDHCAIAINATHFFMAGGEIPDTRYSNKAYLFEGQAQIWHRVADMSVGRYGFSCGLVQGQSGDLEILVAGGRMEGHVLVDSVEIYSLEKDEWRSAAALPKPIGYAASANTGTTVALIGGSDGINILTSMHIYNSVQDAWELSDVEVLVPRENVIAIAVPSNFGPCE